jgi:hypothetical protein
MIRSRPCRICRRWFQPHPRAGDRQRVCSAAECQKERHRRSCADWHRRHAGDERRERFRERITETATACASSPQLAWDVVRDAVGMEVSVVIEESSKVVENRARDAVSAEASVIMKELRRVARHQRRDEIAAGGPAP